MKHLILLFAMILLPVAGFAQGGTTGTLTWSITDGTLTVGGTGAMPDYTHYYYNSSGSPWSAYKNNITSLIIEAGVTTIGHEAFRGCSNLTSVTIGNSVTTIGDYAFYGCISLTSVTIPNSVTTIGGCAFDGCSGLASVTLGNSVTEIEGDAFSGCISLTSVTIPNSVTEIGGEVFWGCISLTSVTIPSSVTEIRNSTFKGCISLTSIIVDADNPNYTAEDGVLFNKAKTELIQCAGGKTGTYTVPNSVTTIEEYAFAGCSSLTSITIDPDNPNYTTEDGVLFNKTKTVLIQCPGGKTGTYAVPNSVTTINKGAFSGCNSLTSVVVPNSVAEIGENAFAGCSSLASITVDAGNPNYTAEDGVLFNKAKTLLIQCPGGKTGTYTVPNPVTTIGSGAFTLCSSLTSVTIPNPVTTIGMGTFYGCSSLTSVTIPNSITEIGWNAFEDCSSLTSVTIPNSVTEIGNSAFAGCSSLTSVIFGYSVATIDQEAFRGCGSLTSITIPNSVTEIGYFAFEGCGSLEDVYVGWATPIDIENRQGVFNGVYVASCTLHVPAGTEALYGVANVWKDFHITGPASLIVSPTLNIPASGGSENLTVTSDVSWTAISSDSWVTVTPSSGSDNGTVTVTAAANTGAARMATISITGGGVTRTVGVIQAAGTPAPSLTVSPTTANIAATGGTESITVTSNISWTAVSSETWATVSTSSGSNNGTVTVTVTANTGATRTATITITGGGITHTVNITQAAATSPAPSLTVSPSTLTVPATGGTESIAVTSNINWTVSSSETWAIVSPPSGSNNGTVTVTATANTGVARTATITITGGGVAQTVNITQAAATAPAPNLTVSPSTASIAATGGTESITVTSSISWTAVSSETWATVSPTSGSNNGTVTVTVTANTGAARTATIIITGSGITHTVNITQAAAPAPAPSLTVSPATLTVPATGGTESIAVTSNINWTVSSSETWAIVFPASGSNNDTITVFATANTGAARTATITVTGGGIAQTVSITQAAETPAPSLTVSPAMLHIAASGGLESVTVTSDVSWTAAASSPWLILTATGDSRLTVVAAPNTGYARTDSIAVTAGGVTRYIVVAQDAAQQIIAEPTAPVDNRGEIEIALEIPVGEEFNITFTVTLPAGFHLDREATSLVSELLSGYRLSITPDSHGGWVFEITPSSSLRIAGETVYREIVDIVYTTSETVKPGSYEVTLQDIDLSFASAETVIHQDEIKVPVSISAPSGLTSVEALTVWYVNGILTVHTPKAERIEIYSVSGQRLYVARKEAGKATFDLNGLPRGVLIVRGGSGWVRKIVR